MNEDKLTLLYFPIEPRAKQSFRIGTRNYQSKSVTSFQRAIHSMVYAQKKSVKPYACELHVSVEFIWKYPKAWSMKKINSAEAGTMYRKSRPDIDNLCKGVFDALNGVIWIDDSQIVSLNAAKYYGRESCIRMRIEPC